MKKYLILYFSLICTLLSFQEGEAKTLHAILIADTVNGIGMITSPDVKNIHNELKTISKHTNSDLKVKFFAGREFQREKVIGFLQGLKVDSSDGVIFYFSGHGYRTKGKDTPWPFITFKPYQQGIDLLWIADTVRSKKPQFALVLADCCNNYIERGFNNEPKNIFMNLHKRPPHYPGYEQLFKQAKGCMVMCSCSEGQFSYGCHLGGLFTNCFLASMNKEIAQPSPSWKNLVERATSYIKHIQKPICKVYH